MTDTLLQDLARKAATDPDAQERLTQERKRRELCLECGDTRDRYNRHGEFCSGSCQDLNTLGKLRAEISAGLLNDWEIDPSDKNYQHGVTLRKVDKHHHVVYARTYTQGKGYRIRAVAKWLKVPKHLRSSGHYDYDPTQYDESMPEASIAASRGVKGLASALKRLSKSANDLWDKSKEQADRDKKHHEARETGASQLAKHIGTKATGPASWRNEKSTKGRVKVGYVTFEAREDGDGFTLHVPTFERYSLEFCKRFADLLNEFSEKEGDE